MKIAVDKNQFTGSHEKSNKLKHEQLKNMGHEIVPTPLPFGDYALITDDVAETIKRRGDKLKKQDLMGDIKIAVDTKKDLLECVSNICSSSHGRFRDEVILAQKIGAKLYVLVEEPNINEIRDIFKWVNPRAKRYYLIRKMHTQGRWLNITLPKAPPTNGQTLAKAMLTFEMKYGCKFLFCKPEETGAKIVELLGGNNDD